MGAEELVMLASWQSRSDYQAALDGLNALVEERSVEVDIRQQARNDDVGHEVHIPGSLVEDFVRGEQLDAADDSFEDCYRLPELENLALASIELSNGTGYGFTDASEEDEPRRVVISDSGTEDDLLDDELRPVTAFQCFSPHPSNLFLD